MCEEWRRCWPASTMKLIAPLRAASLQLFYRLMSHAEVECRHSLAWVVRDEWPLAMANDPNASVRFENMQGLLPRVRTAPQHGPDRYLRLEMACGIAAGESRDVFENEDKSMQASLALVWRRPCVSMRSAA
ncbi:hypothetical protein DXU07_09070 [Bradyrhizobium elkanii]|jgi:hypothetical protein|nr:hypothetical protein BLN97_06225 [Bradyrhizobium elkanii]